MGVIVDNNVVALVLVQQEAGFVPVLKAILKGRLKLTYGGKLAREYFRNRAVADSVQELESAGRCHLVSGPRMDALEATLNDDGVLVSNDPHIIALAQASCARLLCTRDRDLMTDFRNGHLINRPRGRIYTGIQHRRMTNIACIRCRAS